MRLTIVHKDSFVRAVMDDLPDLRKTEEHASVMSAVMEKLKKGLPPKVFCLYEDPELRRYLMCHYQIINNYHSASKTLTEVISKLHYREQSRLSSDFGAVPISIPITGGDPLCESLIAYSLKLAEVSKVRRTLEGLIKGVSTLNRAKEVLPASLHKYLPKETSNTATNSDRSLPVISNVLLDLTSAGWPKAPAPAAS